jgi:hypothetical protein
MTQTILHPEKLEGWRGTIRDGQVVEEDETTEPADEEAEQEGYGEDDPTPDDDEAEEYDDHEDEQDASEPERMSRPRRRRRTEREPDIMADITMNGTNRPEVPGNKPRRVARRRPALRTRGRTSRQQQGGTE